MAKQKKKDNVVAFVETPVRPMREDEIRKNEVYLGFGIFARVGLR